MNEFELIRRYFATASCAQPVAGVALGIGDDCALLQLSANAQMAVSTDTLVAGVHFPDPCDPFLLGQRALAVAASDLAAMGAAPLGFTLALSLPAVDEIWLQGFAAGLNQMAKACGLALVGGDTTRGPLSLTLTVFGSLPAGQALTRSGAQVGDLLCVSGELGSAAAALPLVLGQQQVAAELAEPLLKHYWSPAPQLLLGQALRGKATAALDVSDGLLADCAHIAQASGLALQIELSKLPIAPQVHGVAGESAIACALGGGDDYVLAFTLPAHYLPALHAQWPNLSVIGRTCAGSGVQLLDAAGYVIAAPRAGYQHFGSSND